MLSQEAIQKILGIETKIHINPEEMAEELEITFYPYTTKDVNLNVLNFKNKLEVTLKKFKANIISFDEAFENVSFKKRAKLVSLLLMHYLSLSFKKLLGIDSGKNYIGISVFFNIIKRKKIKKGVTVITLNDLKTGELPADKVQGFRKNTVIAILNRPDDINKDSDFHQHFNKAMSLFAYHMANIVILVDEEQWIVYNLNASHPVFKFDKDFDKNVLYNLVPKIAAPISPNRLHEFILSKKKFDITKKPMDILVDDFIKSGLLLEKTGLYPKGKSVDSLPFRNKFYRWIGDLFLDHRSGMSYGFLALQLPTKLSKLIPFKEAEKLFNIKISKNKDYFLHQGNIYLKVHLPQGRFCLQVPEVWVLSQRSGANKTKIDPNKDLIKLGLYNGKMMIETPLGLKLKKDYKPSFDTRVILAHAAGNAIVASILAFIKPEAIFPKRLEERGIALSHWHGYVNPEFILSGWYVHGQYNPHVSCSSPQSAIYAIDGKMRVFIKNIFNNIKNDYFGDIHIEPHHGSNMTFSSLEEFGKFVSFRKNVASLGNLYLDLHYKVKK
ncbi:MAG: hypothetical protein AAB593_00175 [Patescibacteria group bacterium]